MEGAPFLLDLLLGLSATSLGRAWGGGCRLLFILLWIHFNLGTSQEQCLTATLRVGADPLPHSYTLGLQFSKVTAVSASPTSMLRFLLWALGR